MLLRKPCWTVDDIYAVLKNTGYKRNVAIKNYREPYWAGFISGKGKLAFN